MRKYDFEKLVDRFEIMSDYAVRVEYGKVLNKISRLQAMNLAQDMYYEYIEPLRNAEMFLEGYLARLCLRKCGFYERLDGEWCLDNGRGIDVLHSAQEL